MSTTQRTPDRYRIDNVLQFIEAVEGCYGVSISFWVSVDRGPDSRAHAYIWVTCSGLLADRLPEGAQPRKYAIEDREEYAIGEALYFATLYLERILFKVGEPVSLRPSLS